MTQFLATTRFGGGEHRTRALRRPASPSWASSIAPEKLRAEKILKAAPTPVHSARLRHRKLTDTVRKGVPLPAMLVGEHRLPPISAADRGSAEGYDKPLVILVFLQTQQAYAVSPSWTEMAGWKVSTKAFSRLDRSPVSPVNQRELRTWLPLG